MKNKIHNIVANSHEDLLEEIDVWLKDNKSKHLISISHSTFIRDLIINRNTNMTAVTTIHTAIITYKQLT